MLTPAGFAKPKPLPPTQTWFLAVSKAGVAWRREGEAMQFSADGW